MFYHIFEEALKAHPKRTSMTAYSGSAFLTYEDLNRHTIWVANHLHRWGVTKGDRVAILVKDEAHHLIFLLALSLLKAVYVPFEIDTPIKKVHFATDVLDVNYVVVDDTALITKFNLLSKDRPNVKILNISNDIRPIPKPTQTLRFLTTENFDEHNEYMFYSSGTTGEPKAILAGKGIKYWADILKGYFSDKRLKRTLVTRGPGFDARIFEYLIAFSTHSSLHFLNNIERQDLEAILKYCEAQAEIRKPIDCILLISSQLKGEHAEPYIQRLAKSKLKYLMVTGDVLTPTLKSLCKKYKISLLNCYGPTEANFGVTMDCVDELPMFEDSYGNAVTPIGIPKLPVKTFIYNNTLHITSPFLGAYATPGYKGTEFKMFVGRRAFNTGDIVTLEAIENGALFYHFHEREFCKISGVKVYPKQVENYLLNFRDDDGQHIQAAVVAKKIRDKDCLVGYIVPSPKINTKKLEQYLDERLSAQEQPTLYVIDVIPTIERNQKIDADRKVLKALVDDSRLLFLSSGSPQPKRLEDATLQSIKKIWSDILEKPHIDIDIDFLRHGGSSLDAQRMILRIQQEVDPEYDYPKFLASCKTTVRSIANSISSQQPIAIENIGIIKCLIYQGDDKQNIFFIADILGDAYFTYIKLAQEFSKFWGCNIYGISNPGALGLDRLPKDTDATVTQIISAIKSVKSTGQIHLAGFSLGSWWAYEVAKKIYLDDNDLTVGAIHLLDGLPPELYHRLPNAAHVDLLQTLINMIIKVLNNDYYKENIAAITIDEKYRQLDKLTQINELFTQLHGAIKHKASKNIIGIAQHNLRCLYATKPADIQLPFKPLLYLSSEKNKYQQIKDSIPDLSPDSSEYQYCYWNHYFESLCKKSWSVVDEHEHHVNPKDTYSNNEFFWKDIKSEYETNGVITLNATKNYNDLPGAFYCINNIGEIHGDIYQLHAYFLNKHKAHILSVKLQELNLAPRLVYIDRNLQTIPDSEADISINEYFFTVTLFCNIPFSNLADLTHTLKALNISPYNVKKEILPMVNFCKMYLQNTIQTATINLLIYAGSGVRIFTLSMNIYACPDLIIEILHNKFGINPYFISNDKSKISYKYKLTHPICESVYKHITHEPQKKYHIDFNWDDDSDSDSDSENELENETHDTKPIFAQPHEFSGRELTKMTRFQLTKSMPLRIDTFFSPRALYCSIELSKEFMTQFIATIAPYSARQYKDSSLHNPIIEHSIFTTKNSAKGQTNRRLTAAVATLQK